MHLTKFHHPTFNQLEVIMKTNKLTNAENVHLTSQRYASR